MLIEFECPICSGHIHERWGLNGSNLGIRVMYWHAMLNPGLAFNELILGQRIPSEMYVCKSCTSPMSDRSYIYCADCGSFHNGRMWSGKNAFGNWLGLVCPTCGGRIACLRNASSQLILFLTTPFWWLPAKQFGPKLIERSYRRIARSETAYIDQISQQPKPIKYWMLGLLFGLIMNVTIAFCAAASIRGIGVSSIWGFTIQFVSLMVAGSVPCILGGLGFGLTMKLIMNRLGDSQLHLTFDENGKPISNNKPRLNG